MQSKKVLYILLVVLSVLVLALLIAVTYFVINSREVKQDGQNPIVTITPTPTPTQSANLVPTVQPTPFPTNVASGDYYNSMYDLNITLPDGYNIKTSTFEAGCETVATNVQNMDACPQGQRVATDVIRIYNNLETDANGIAINPFYIQIKVDFIGQGGACNATISNAFTFRGERYEYKNCQEGETLMNLPVRVSLSNKAYYKYVTVQFVAQNQTMLDEMHQIMSTIK
jgi:hypothetical protein